MVKYKKHAIIRRKYKVLIYLTKTVKDYQDLPYSIFFLESTVLIYRNSTSQSAEKQKEEL